MTHVAVLGLGIMGSGIAHNILKAGYPLTVYNRTKEKAAALIEAGAQWAPSRRCYLTPSPWSAARCHWTGFASGIQKRSSTV